MSNKSRINAFDIIVFLIMCVAVIVCIWKGLDAIYELGKLTGISECRNHDI